MLGVSSADQAGGHLGEEELGDPAVILAAQTEMEVGAERLGDGPAEKGSDPLTADPPHELADEEAERVDVVAVLAPGLPPGLLRGEQRRS